MNYTVFVTLEPYLAQWLQHEGGGEYPIKLRRGSAEADILELYLKPQPKDPDYIPQLKPLEGQYIITIPCFKRKDIRTYNYLSEKAEVCLHLCIRNRFKVMFWKELYTMAHVTQRVDFRLQDWMEEHGIEVDDKNYNTLTKIFQRGRAAYCENARLTRRHSCKSAENNQEINPTSDELCPSFLES